MQHLRSVHQDFGPSQEVGELVEHLWQEALGELAGSLAVPLNTIKITQVAQCVWRCIVQLN